MIIGQRIRPGSNTAAMVIAMGILIASAMIARSQSDPRPAHHDFRIAGRIVNSSTGEPLARAAIAALAEQDSQIVASVHSDADGNFALEHLPAGKYPLTASKRGFRTAYYDEHEDFNSAIVTGDSQDTEHLQFQLAPAAILHGIVTGDGGDPIEGANVMLFRRPDSNHPGERVIQVETTFTDDTGAYEFSSLSAGEYFVAVKAEPWYALHSRANRKTGAAGVNLDVAYPITFFDSTIDQASATPIALAEGSREEANVNLHAVPALHLTLPRSGRRGAPSVELRHPVFGTEIMTAGSDTMAGQGGTTEVTGIAPGHYEITHGNPPRTIEVDAASDLEIDANAGTPSVSVTGTLRNASGVSIDEDATLVLESSDNAGIGSQVNTFARKSQFQFDSVLPGRWNVSVIVAGSGQVLPVIAVTKGTRSVAGNRIVVGDQPLNITVTVSRAQTRVSGFARMNGKPAAGVMIVLVPREPAAYRNLVRRDQSDSDGSFSLRDVPPGMYTVVAIEDGWKLDWHSREVIARYLPGGLSVTVGETPDSLVKLTQPVAAVPR